MNKWKATVFVSGISNPLDSKIHRKYTIKDASFKYILYKQVWGSTLKFSFSFFIYFSPKWFSLCISFDWHNILLILTSVSFANQFSYQHMISKYISPSLPHYPHFKDSFLEISKWKMISDSNRNCCLTLSYIFLVIAFMNNTYVALKNLPLSCFNSLGFEDGWIEEHNVDKVQQISLKMTLIN